MIAISRMRAILQFRRKTGSRWTIVANAFPLCVVFLFSLAHFSHCADLEEIQKRGVLLHLGVPYANFVTGSGDGLDVELMKLFAEHLGVGYQYVPSNWTDVIADLTGKRFSFEGESVRVVAEVPVRGDVIASGMTILPQRRKVISFGTPTFPTQVWLVARHDSSLSPILPSGDMVRDIASVKSQLKGRDVLGIADTCIDPDLYHLKDIGARTRCFTGKLNELAPAIINGEAELTLLDVADSIIALEKWPGKLKVIGPISPVQDMSCAFSPEADRLRQSFNTFFDQIRRDGTYSRLVRKYYPTAPAHFPEFFEK
ncbi:MAG: transporter substrate-binding domain-containing protein [Syntrophobacter sp.]